MFVVANTITTCILSGMGYLLVYDGAVPCYACGSKAPHRSIRSLCDTAHFSVATAVVPERGRSAAGNCASSGKSPPDGCSKLKIFRNADFPDHAMIISTSGYS